MKPSPLPAAAFAVLLCLASSLHADDWRLRRIDFGGKTVTVDNTKATFTIKVDDDFKNHRDQEALTQVLFPSYTAAYEAAKLRDQHILPSVSLVMNKGKAINDGLYAAIELAVESPAEWPGGMGMLPLATGKAQFLEALLARLDTAKVTSRFGEEAARLAVTRLVEALRAGGAQFPEGPDRGNRLSEAETVGPYPARPDSPRPLPARYDPAPAKDLSRKPVSFYTWTDQLRTIYRRDTALQAPFDPEFEVQVAAAALIAREILADPALRNPYNRLNALYSRLTNPLIGPTADQVLAAAGGEAALNQAINNESAARDLGAKPHPPFALFRPSASREIQASPVGSMDEFIAKIRSGEVSLKPDAQSGWYDYQQYALEPLLLPDKTPEGKKLTLDAKYRTLMESAFKSTAAQTRETHVKALGMMGPGMNMWHGEITPDFAVEPWATSHLRLHDAYQFLRSKLPPLVPAYASLKPLREGGKPGQTRADKALSDMAFLALGIELLACRDVGVEPGLAGTNLQTGPGPLMKRAEQWLESWQTDPDMARDVRMMIQVARSPNTYWAVTGVRLTKLKISYVEKPVVKGEGFSPTFADSEVWLPTEQFIQVIGLEEPLDREEFRALCDQAKTTDAIVLALQHRGLDAQPPTPGSGGLPLPGGPAVVLFSLIILAMVGVAVRAIAQGAFAR